MKNLIYTTMLFTCFWAAAFTLQAQGYKTTIGAPISAPLKHIASGGTSVLEGYEGTQSFSLATLGRASAVPNAANDKEQITYRQFSNAIVQQVSTKCIEKIIFADGWEVRFNEPNQAETKPIVSRFRFNPFAESAAFHKGQFVVGMGLGVDNNIGIKYKENKISLPPVWAMMELPLKHNIGVGVSGGMMQWSPKSSEGIQYTYWSISPRIAYHLNLVEQVDLYGGVAATGRFATMEAGDGENSISLMHNQFDASIFAGLRYYFNNFLGVYGEYGGDNIACARLGLAFRFGR